MSFAWNFMEDTEDISNGKLGAKVMTKASWEHIEYCIMGKNGSDEGTELLPDVCLWREGARESSSSREVGLRKDFSSPPSFFLFNSVFPLPWYLSYVDDNFSFMNEFCNSLHIYKHGLILGFYDWMSCPPFRYKGSEIFDSILAYFVFLVNCMFTVFILKIIYSSPSIQCPSFPIDS